MAFKKELSILRELQTGAIKPARSDLDAVHSEIVRARAHLKELKDGLLSSLHQKEIKALGVYLHDLSATRTEMVDYLRGNVKDFKDVPFPPTPEELERQKDRDRVEKIAAIIKETPIRGLPVEREPFE